ncbi:MAG: Rieske (2Fe-2S) protein [Rhodobiaceae bacterium]|jgi:phenylpropionate dioxygenase-like ring-hydroxylating dioxygenase large terminal subunit|nr:Rieske (2Fe-2S) protein [Rhodobiaceae bacterium]
MVETITGTDRSAGVTYQELLDEDSREVPAIFRVQNPLPPGPTKVPAERYYSKEFHDLEVEKVWKRVWQMACHEDDIPNVGDYNVYNIARLSFLIVRSAEDEFKAFHNVCLHRGRLLRTKDGIRAREFRCSFHGWTWNLDGSLKEVPCHWDFPTVSEKTHSLPEVKIGRWGGFLFINPDVNAESLEDYLGNLSEQFPNLPFDRRYKAVHVARILRCNWKIAQEAFSEAYHSVVTHPTILETIGDANTQYDVFGNYSRAMSGHATPSPHIEKKWEHLEDGRVYTRLRHALTGHIYESDGDGIVCVTDHKGKVSKFKFDGKDLTWIEGPMTHVDPNMCDWIGGKQLPDTEDIPVDVPVDVPKGKNLRQVLAEPVRESFKNYLGDKIDDVTDAQLLDAIYYTVFPNFHPWGSFNQICYRFRPNGDNPEECIHECMYMVPAPEGEKRPAPAKIHWLGPDDDYCDAPELGMLAKVFNQDVMNMPNVQKGLKTMKNGEIIFGNYGETKPRHFHKILNEWLDKP